GGPSTCSSQCHPADPGLFSQHRDVLRDRAAIARFLEIFGDDLPGRFERKLPAIGSPRRNGGPGWL
ncbi:hypothetical protein K0U83_24440, partial [bacterium]|nr:hypothetical protein [bacterium]